MPNSTDKSPMQNLCLRLRENCGREYNKIGKAGRPGYLGMCVVVPPSTGKVYL